MNVTDQAENRFVILYHQVSDEAAKSLIASRENRSGNHWDLMFECEGELLAWAVEAEPLKSQSYSAIRLSNHRLDYLTYEGPISQNRGTVSRTLAGLFRVDSQSHLLTKTLAQWVSEGEFQLTLNTTDSSWKIRFKRTNSSHWELEMKAENC